MVRSHLLTLGAPLAVAAALLTPTNADAANRFAVVGIENTTQHTIRLSHKWGDGEWHTDVLKPGERKRYWHTYAFANENKSPRFHVRFDSDLTPGRLFTINYDLKKNAAPAHDWADAHKYAFTYDGNRTFIDLIEKK